jgi:hypothetical protein
MKILSIWMLTILISGSLFSQNILDKAKKELEKSAGNTGSSGKSLTNDEIIKGLKEALNVGASKASSTASRPDGFFKNPLIKIPFPPDVLMVERKARQLGLGSQADAFIKSMNRAAEEASKEAAPVFINAIKSMTIADGLSILKGKESAATDYLKTKTTAELTSRFSPIVKKAIAKAQVAKFWKPVITKYNRIPGVSKKNPDLDKYITEKTLQGLFTLVAQEEAKIRKDPASRVTDILKKVFGGL